MDEPCPHRTTIEDSGSTICTDCGLVLENFIAEEYSFADHTRCCAAPVDSNGPSHSKRLDRAKTMINNYTAHLHMSDALNSTALQVFEDCIDSTFLSKKKLEVRCAACVFCSAKLHGFDRSEEEVATALECNSREFRQCMVSMRASLAHLPYGVELMTTVNAERLVQRMLDRLQTVLVRYKINRNDVLKSFYRHMESLETIKGKKPQNVCATVLCHVLRQSYGVACHEVSEALHISSVYMSADIR